jgi:hypothetical protein
MRRAEIIGLAVMFATSMPESPQAPGMPEDVERSSIAAPNLFGVLALPWDYSGKCVLVAQAWRRQDSARWSRIGGA